MTPLGGRLDDDGAQRLPPRVPAARRVRARASSSTGSATCCDGPRRQSLRPRYADRRHGGPAGAARARRRRARRGPRRRRPHVREPDAHAPARAGGDARRSASPSRWSCGTSSCPSRTARRARRELARLRRRDPSAVAFCHQSPWHVPIRWFVLFRDEERRLAEDERGRHAPALPHHDPPGDAAGRAGGRAAAPVRPRADRRAASSICTSGWRVRPVGRWWSSTTASSARS